MSVVTPPAVETPVAEFVRRPGMTKRWTVEEYLALCEAGFIRAEDKVELLEGEAGVAPGQACALYSGIGEDARVYGVGFILRSEREAAAEAALKDLLQSVVAA